jgi:hypothetical protein
MDHGIWRQKHNHSFDENLAESLRLLFPDASFLDLGCGWAKLYARHLGADGYDGNVHTLNGDVLDLSKPFDLGKKYDVVMCLEVIEHIPAKFEKIVLDNICKHAKSHLVISWARPGQKGRGHVNCRSREYVIEQFEQRGFELLWAISDRLRTQCILSWFRNNLLVFRMSQT